MCDIGDVVGTEAEDEGESSDSRRSCDNCHGSGLVPNHPDEPYFGGSDICPHCCGNGIIDD